MTVYSFESVVGQTIAFNALTDILSVSSASTGLSFSESGGSVTVRKSTGEQVILSGTTLAQLSSGNNGTAANLVLGGSNGFALFGDDKSTSSADSSGNSPTIAGLLGPLAIYGLGGGDTLNASTITEDVAVFGGSGAGDSTDGGDTISIGTGNATVSGNAGADTVTFITNGATKQANIYGGAGNDTINAGGTAGSGKTLIYGNLGSDVINLSAGAGNTGDATIFGGNGIGDTGDGADTITTGTGNTQITAGGGNDTIVLNITANSATVAAGVGNDSITDNAILTGEAIFSLGTGNDSIVLDALGTGSDVTVYGAYAGGDTADGADTITLSSGAGTGVTVTAVIQGHGGNDTISVNDANDTVNSTILGGQGNDNITGDASTGTSNLDGGAGNDTLTGGDGADTLVGGAGADNITAGAGNDSIDAGDDGDTIVTTGGNDTVLGGGGADTVTGNAGTESIDGGDGNDNIDGAAGSDTITGGAGDDTITGGDDGDSITGGEGADNYIFNDATPGTDTITGSITDLTNDLFIFDNSDLLGGAAVYTYSEQTGGDITADGTVIVLTTAYSSVANAAAAIAADATVTATNGIFAFFNSSDNTAYIIETDNLAGDGTETNIANLTGVGAVTQMADFSIGDFQFQA